MAPAAYFPVAFDTSLDTCPGGGLILEFGVLYGGTWIWMMERLRALGLMDKYKMIGFDSWQGLPPETEGVWAPERHCAGAFATKKDGVVKKMVNEFGFGETDNFYFVDGFFEETLTEDLQKTLLGNKASFINIDVDIHSSTVQALEFCLPLLQTGTVIWFDDWKDPLDEHDTEWGEHLAWRQFLDTHPNIRVTKEVADPVYNMRFMVLEVLGVGE